MARIFYLLLSVILLSHPLLGQRNCGTDILHQHQKDQDTALYNAQENFKEEINSIVESRRGKTFRIAASSDTFIIPVVVHVIYNNSTTNISDAQILSQIDVLNEDFLRKAGTPGFNSDPVGADTKIKFCLANADPNGNVTTGIVRKSNSRAYWTLNDQSTLKAQSRWPSDQYLNIWVCRLEEPDPTKPDILGYSTYPSGFPLAGSGSATPADLDGVVIDYRVFGRIGTAGTDGRMFYNKGRTTTHEVGHWLGLYHLWGENDFPGCGTDYVNDTPIDREANNGPACTDFSDCVTPGVFTPDMSNNYMDYSPDACMNIFTQGQRDRMRTVLEFAPRRAALSSSMGCCIPQQSGQLPLVEEFETVSPDNFNSVNPDASSVTWSVSAPGAYAASSSSIMMDNSASPVGQIDYLESDYIKINKEEPALEFDLAYALNGSAVSDCLVVQYSLNCTTWFTLVTLKGNDLITTSRVTSNFTPFASEWKRMRVDLDPMDKKTIGRVRFVNYSNGGNNLYLDNINVYKTSESLLVVPYPNPNSGELHVQVIIDQADDIHFELFDVLGQKIWEETDLQKTTYTKTIYLDGLARGIYILRVSDRKQRASRKIFYTY